MINNKKSIFFSNQFIQFILAILITILLISPKFSISQEDSFVGIKDGKFMIEGNEYFPLAINYAIDVVKDINGDFNISPHAQYCKWNNCGFYCGKNTQEWNAKIRKHVDKIAEMGFNTIRLVGLGLNYNPDKNGTGKLVSKVYKVQKNPENLTCFERNKRIKIGCKTIDQYVELYDAFIQIVKEHNIEFPNKKLKLILTTGTGGLHYVSNKYTKFLSALGEKFKNDPTVFAYEPNFEGYYLGYPKNEKNQKYERAENFAQWYYALKDVAPLQLVTYGASLIDVFNWDAQIFPVDFINLHHYPDLKTPYNSDEFERYKRILKWFSEAYDKPWIIGEIGLGANDIAHQKSPTIATEIQQKEFANSTLAYSRWYGSIGYSWWQYKEVSWFSLDHPKANANFYGLIRNKDAAERSKIAAEAFLEFDPFQECLTCFDPNPEIYYNPHGYKFLSLKGRFLTKEGKPVKNVFIICRSKDKRYQTFSDENGEFNLYTTPNDQIYSLIASYPGMTVVQLGKWGGPKLETKLNLTIDYLDKDLLPFQSEQ